MFMPVGCGNDYGYHNGDVNGEGYGYVYRDGNGNGTPTPNRMRRID